MELLPQVKGSYHSEIPKKLLKFLVAVAGDRQRRGPLDLGEVNNSMSQTDYTAFDPFGRVLSSRQVIGTAPAYLFGCSYNLAGGLTSITYPSQRVVSFGIDGAGRVSTINGVYQGNSSGYSCASCGFSGKRSPISVEIDQRLQLLRSPSERSDAGFHDCPVSDRFGQAESIPKRSERSDADPHGGKRGAGKRGAAPFLCPML
jgi:hypothetical protein